MENKLKSINKRTMIEMTYRIFRSLAVICICLIILFPFYWLVVSSLKTKQEIFAVPPTLFPKEITLENYVHVIKGTKIPRYFLNSFINVVFTASITLLAASLAAYGVSRFKFKGKNTFFITILLTQVMPMTTLIIPLYIFWGKLNALNSYFSINSTYIAIQTPVAIWLLTSYFNSIPKEIDEAARIDGSSNLGILFRIVLPLAKPGLMATSLVIIISVWQELLIAITFTTKDEMKPLMAGISSFITRTGIQWGLLNAAGLLISIPVIIIFMFFQNALVAGLTGGSVKG